MVFGILGPNGSGKTTTLGILLGVLNASAGSFSWFGNGEKNENRLRIGALLETPNFYPYLTAVQNLQLVAKIKNVVISEEKINELLKTVNLHERGDSKFKTYSLGMKQRLAIASALIGNPEVLVLDEPTNGLDPEGIAEIRELIIKIGQSSKTIIIASHILDEVEKVCTHCAILKKGELIRTGTINDIIGNHDVTLVKVSSNDISALVKIVTEQDNMSIYKEMNGSIIIKTPKETKSSDINRFFYEKGQVLSELTVFNESLENQFLEIVKES